MAHNPVKAIDLKSFLPYHLSVLEQQISESISQHYSERFNLSRMQWRVLSTLAMLDGITAREICDFTHMEKMQASRAIAGLETDGLLTHTKSLKDHRASLLSLTDHGHEVYLQIVPEVLAAEQRIFSSLSKHERETLQQIVVKLCNRLET